MADELEEQSIDELWAQATGATDEAVDDTDTIPDDDSDLLGDEPETANDTDESASDAASSQFNIEAHLPRIAEYLQKEVLPKRDEQLLHEAQNRARQSQKARDEQIKAQLAPLVDQFKRLEEQGLYTREDSQREYARAYQAVNAETEKRERDQADADVRQRWLAQSQGNSQQQAQQQAPDSYESVKQIASTEVTMQNILDQSGLTEQDPELAAVPLTITHADPKEALDYFKFKVATAVQEKQQRVKASAKPKPMIDMGHGGSGGAGNPLSGIEDTDQLWELAMKG